MSCYGTTSIDENIARGYHFLRARIATDVVKGYQKGDLSIEEVKKIYLYLYQV